MEELLPVTMEQPQRRVMPNGALALVLHTCEFDAGNYWAKQIAIAALNTLNARDYFGVLIYGGQGEEWLFKPELVTDKARMAGLISGAWPGDMPSFDATLQMAHSGLKGLNAASKHIIVISDADPSGPTSALLDGIVGDRISISTVAIQPHTATDVKKMKGHQGHRRLPPPPRLHARQPQAPRPRPPRHARLQGRAALRRAGDRRPPRRVAVRPRQDHGLHLRPSSAPPAAAPTPCRPTSRAERAASSSTP
jgi:hypothetical protein